jgi:ferredoxin-NADP reductase
VARGPELLPLTVARIVRESADIVSVELVDPSGTPLPAWEPGAHLDLQLVTRQQRQYSLCGDPADRHTYRIGVLREALSRGASMYIHDFLRVGSTVYARPPRNLFPLVPAPRYLLLAAGIGITPILPMAARLAGTGAAWEMNYAVRDEQHLPFRADIARLGDRVTVNSRERAGRLDLGKLLAPPRPGTAVYACGPGRFIDAVEAAMAQWPAGSLHLERFEPKPITPRPNAAFTVHCVRSDVTVEVPADRSMLQALTDHELPVTGSCLRGVCGSCAVRVVGGGVEHRDSLTTDDATTVMYPCVSRATTARLAVDL